MARKSHSCSKVEAKASHRIAALEPFRGQGHKAPDGTRCWCHGHCAECGGAVVMCRLGKYHHI